MRASPSERSIEINNLQQVNNVSSIKSISELPLGRQIMSTHPALTTQQRSDSTSDARPAGSHQREICLDALRAAKWIICLEELLAADESRSAVSHFYNELSDACWLARWKRENVVVDIEICATPELIAQLVPADTMTETQTLEDILSTLAENPVTNHAC